MRRRTLMSGAFALSSAALLAACGGGSDSGSGSGSGSGGGASAFNGATTGIVNPSTAKGGTLRVANEGDWDSLDPGNTYYAYAWNFARLYTRTLTTFKPAPGAEGGTLVPDLATDLGKASDDSKTWTYTLREGLKYDDGTPITSADVKYGIQRSMDKTTYPNGPTYFNDFLLDVPDGYSPYKDGDLKAIETPDDKTIVFHLNKTFSSFDYFGTIPATAPVPKAKDTKSKYKTAVVSSGPYKFADYQDGKSFKLVRNDQWDASTDSVRKALPDEIDVALNVNADDIDQRLLSGDLDLAVTGIGLGTAARAQVLADPDKKKNSDAALANRTWFVSINSEVKPFDNVDVRKAVNYAIDRTAFQTAWGGPIAGGDVATGLMPPSIPGEVKFDDYAVSGVEDGIAKAKALLSQAGFANGFETNYSYRNERPSEKAAAEAVQQSLAKVGIKVTLKGFPQADYFPLYAGKPSYAKNNGLGLLANGWASDWPDGFGFLSQLVDSRVIRETGGASNFSVRDPEVDKLIDQAVAETDNTAREKLWADIDKKVMDGAWVYPGVWAKGLLYRPETLTNVYVTSGFAEYDYVSLGVKQS